MARDLRPLLHDWPYDPKRTVRMVRGADGKRRVQVRLPLGIEQYELDGRPDGARPHGSASHLVHWERRLAAYRARHVSDTGFVVPPSACCILRDEAMLYYYRYVLLFQVGEYGRSVRDTARNLRCLDLMARYAERADDRETLEQYRPYIIRMNRASRALLALRRSQYEIALRELQAGIETIEGLAERDTPAFAFEKLRSLEFLKQLAREIRRKRPLSPRERLQRRLKRAVRAEDYELAARLRDRVQGLDRRLGARKADRSQPTPPKRVP